MKEFYEFEISNYSGARLDGEDATEIWNRMTKDIDLESTVEYSSKDGSIIIEWEWSKNRLCIFIDED